MDAALRAREWEVFFAPRSITKADWQEEIGWALDRCDWFVVVISPAAAASKWLRRELQYALSADHLEDRIIPVVAEIVDFRRVSWTLKILQRVDFSVDFNTGLEQLCRHLQPA